MGCYELSAELNGTNLACLVGDAGVCPSASSLSLKNISCSRFFWFSSSSRALSRREHTQELYLRLYWSYGHCPLQPAKQDTLLTPSRHYLLPWPQLVSPLLHVLVVVLIQGLKLLGFVLNQEVTLFILNTDHKTEHPLSSWDCKSSSQTGLASARAIQSSELQGTLRHGHKNLSGQSKGTSGLVH